MIVAYSGNAYQVDTAENPVADIDKPFGVLTPEFWNNGLLGNKIKK